MPNKNKYTTEIFIQKAKEKHKNKYDYSTVDYKGCFQIIKIICPLHGIFEQKPGNHLHGSGCYKCGREKTANGQRTSLENIIKRGKEIHGEKYDYSKVKYKSSGTKVIIICPLHGEFKQTIDKHIGQKNGCAKCGFEKLAKYKSDNKQTFIEKANIQHKNKYDYSQVVYINSQSKVKIICKEHGSFEQRANSHLRGSGCPRCVKLCFGIDTEEWVKLANKKHENKYNYTKAIYKKYNKLLCIICPVEGHGEFLQTAEVHLNGHGCSKCANCYKPSTKEWIDEAKKVHGDKYDYSKSEYKNHKTKVLITCKNHGDFLQKAIVHVNSQCGCPRCYKRYSKSQIQWLNYLSVRNNNIKHAETENGEYSIPNSAYSADGYDAKTRTVYEYHGSFWHGDIRYYNPEDINPVSKKKFGELLKSTLKKELLIRNLGYNYKCIWGADWINGVKAVTTLQRKWRMCKLSLKKK